VTRAARRSIAAAILASVRRLRALREGGSSLPLEHIVIHERPDLSSPVLITAFAGWNDASEVASSAVRFLIKRYSAPKFASVDADDFFVFTETRPTVKIAEGGRRRIDWPANDLYYARDASAGRDLVMLVGVEPQLHWKAFAGSLLDLAKSLDVSLILSLGGLLADVPHTVSPRLTGSATQPEIQRRLFGLDVHTSSYEGPTGINGVIGAAARERDIPTASIWGNVPHYISASGNPTITGAILRRLAVLLELNLNLAELERQGAAFNAQVSEAIAKNPEVADYVRGLEAKEGVGRVEPVTEEKPEPTGDLPSSESLIQDLEDFFKKQRPPGET
jgi:proteasome assembly chaperone (PAC2) family protein